MADSLEKMLKASKWWKLKRTLEKELMGKKEKRDNGFYMDA